MFDESDADFKRRRAGPATTTRFKLSTADYSMYMEEWVTLATRARTRMDVEKVLSDHLTTHGPLPVECKLIEDAAYGETRVAIYDARTGSQLAEIAVTHKMTLEYGAERGRMVEYIRRSWQDMYRRRLGPT